ncbi:MAG: hypothetical protein P8Y12_00505 [Gammaproteobacteria bacterium]|jgi:hypothetical protein
MSLKKINIAVVLVISVTGALSFLFGSMLRPAHAEEIHSVEWYLDQARPHMLHSCQSAWDMVEQDQDQFIDLVGTISAVSFYNHDFNIERLKALSEERQTELQREFYEEVGELCRQNNQALLAGAVDTALTEAIAKIADEEQ